MSETEKKKKGGCLKIVGIGFAAFVALGILGALVSEDGGSNSGTSSSSTSGGNSAPAEAQEKYAIGDTVSFKDSEWKVLEAREMGSTLGGNVFTEAKQSAGKFVFVRYTVTNNTNEQQAVLFEICQKVVDEVSQAGIMGLNKIHHDTHAQLIHTI